MVTEVELNQIVANGHSFHEGCLEGRDEVFEAIKIYFIENNHGYDLWGPINEANDVIDKLKRIMNERD